MSARHSRGFSLIEIVVVVGIIGVMAAIATPTIQGSMASGRFHASARSLLGTLRNARSLAVARRDIGGRTPVSIGLVVVSDTMIQVFSDIDTVDNGNEQTIETIDLRATERTGTLRLTSPAVGARVRFGRDGAASAAQTWVLRQDNQNQTRTITLAASGFAQLD